MTTLEDHLPIKATGQRSTDRSRTVLDWKCRRARWWGYEYLGRGIVSDGLALDLFLGSVLHDSIAQIAIRTMEKAEVNIDEIATGAAKAVLDTLSEISELQAKEKSCLVEALIRGFYRSVWPTLLAAYPEVIAVEHEMPLKLTDWLTYMTRPDLIMADAEGGLHYPELKSTGWKKESWVLQWATAIQLHSTLKAVEMNLGSMPEDVTILGLYKGWVDQWGKFNSPLVYGYKKNGNPPFTKEEYSYTYQKGFFRTPVWEIPDGVKKWVEDMPEMLLAEQFPRSAPIFAKPDLIDEFFKQLILREAEIRLALQVLKKAEVDGDQGAKDSVMRITFPQNFSACKPGFGHDCEYLRICHGNLADPLQHGFSLRTANHPEEAEGWK